MAGAALGQRYTVLTIEDLAQGLRELPGWSVHGGKLEREVRAGDPWPLLEQVHRAEDELDHHSLVVLTGGAVLFQVWTHVRPGLTRADLLLAGRIEDALRSSGEGSAGQVAAQHAVAGVRRVAVVGLEADVDDRVLGHPDARRHVEPP